VRSPDGQDLPTPKSSRPPESTSTIAWSSATRSGWWKGSTLTATPSRMRRVRSAAAANPTGGDGMAPYSWQG